jgi:hypothetical protein
MAGLEMFREGETIAYIPGESGYGTPGAHIDYGPELVKKVFERPLDLNVIERTDSSYRFQVLIMGALNYGQILGFRYEAKVSKALSMTEEDVLKHSSHAQFKKEYSSFIVAALVDELELSIRFPKGLYATFYAGVSMAAVVSESLMDSAELQRIQANNWFQASENWAQLRVVDPRIGFTYLIYWVPPPRPPRKVVDVL